MSRLLLTGKTRLVITAGKVDAERFRDEILQPMAISLQSGTELYSLR